MSKEAGEAVSEKAETEREEPTPKQLSYVSDLCKRLDIPESDLFGMSRADVSELIERLKERLKK